MCRLCLTLKQTQDLIPIKVIAYTNRIERKINQNKVHQYQKCCTLKDLKDFYEFKH